jgi:hypothetical protein
MLTKSSLVNNDDASDDIDDDDNTDDDDCNFLPIEICRSSTTLINISDHKDYFFRLMK